jgi:hypothetical protein
MSLKLKVLGLGLLAVLATSALAVMNASANGTGGHFVSTATHTNIVGTESGSHILHFIRDNDTNPESRIGCDEESYTGTATAATVESLTITPTYNKCYTTNSNKTGVTIDTNGCTYTFTVTKGTTSTTEQQVHLLCDPGKFIQITHPNCTITIHPQTVNSAVTYTNQVDTNGLHYVTLDVNATFATTNHGLCQFIIPTNDFGLLSGSVTVRGFNKQKEQVSITAT